MAKSTDQNESGPHQSADKPVVLEGKLVAGDAKIAIVVARFNEFVTGHLFKAAEATFNQLGGKSSNLTVAHVPGSFELPVTALNLAKSGDYSAVICLGCVIRGETDHYDHVVEQTAKGIKDVGLQTGLPCIFGVITADTLEQAIHRAGAKMGNMGRNAMMAAVEMADLIETIQAPKK